jgi:hypothetical protein
LKRLPQPNLPTQLRLSPLPSNNSYYEDDDDDVVTELDLHRGYDRPRLVESDDEDLDQEDLTDHIRIRLLIARLRALEKYPGLS